MAERSEDELAALRALWTRLTPPALPDALAESDAETAHAVRWTQAAWSALPVPPARVPHVARRRGRVLRLRAVAVAAALLLAGAGAFLAWRWSGTVPNAPARVVARAPELTPSSAVEVLDVLPERLELRSGPVRLVLLEPPSRPGSGPSGG